MTSEIILPVVVCRNCGMVVGSCICNLKDYGMNPELGANKEPSLRVLNSFAKMFRLITEETKLLDPGDEIETGLLKLRAEMIKGLPLVIGSVIDVETLNPKLLQGLDAISHDATQALAGKRGAYGMRALLTNMGDNRGGPNDLELLIEQFYPQ